MRKRFILFIAGTSLFLCALNAQTWEKTKQLTWNTGDSQKVRAAVDSSDRIHVIWRDETPGNQEIYYKRSTNGGTSWSAAKRLTWSAAISTVPAIAVDSGNAVHVVWRDDTPGKGDIYYKKSTNGGVTWGGSKRITWNPEWSFNPAIAVDSSAIIHVIWSDYTPGNYEIFYKRSTNGGVNWSGAKRFTWNFQESNGPSIAVDSSGNVHATWHDFSPGNYEIFHKKSTNSGASWSGTKRLTWNSGNSLQSTVIVGPGNTIHVVWHDMTPGNWEIYHKKSTDGGASWSASTRITWDSQGSYSPDLVLDSSDRLHVVWYDNAPGNFEIYHKRSTNGGVNWSGAKRLSWSSDHSYYPSITTDTSGNIHVFWDDITPGNHELYYKKGIQ